MSLIRVDCPRCGTPADVECLADGDGGFIANLTAPTCDCPLTSDEIEELENDALDCANSGAWAAADDLPPPPFEDDDDLFVAGLDEFTL